MLIIFSEEIPPVDQSTKEHSSLTRSAYDPTKLATTDPIEPRTQAERSPTSQPPSHQPIQIQLERSRVFIMPEFDEDGESIWSKGHGDSIQPTRWARLSWCACRMRDWSGRTRWGLKTQLTNR